MSPPVVFTSPLALYRVLSRLRSYLFIYHYVFKVLRSCYIQVLDLAGTLAKYALWLRMTYLTIVWGLDTTHAAAIVNVCKGVETIMPTCMSSLADAFVISDYRMLLFSSVAYSLGLGFLAMSTPPVLSKFAGNCAAYTPNCIGATQIVIFYISLLFVAIGVSGHKKIFLSSFAEEPLPIQTKSDQDHPKRKRTRKHRRRKKPGKEMVIWVSSQSSFLEQQMPIQTESDQDDIESKKPGKLRRIFQKLITRSFPMMKLFLFNTIIFVLSYQPWWAQFGIPAILMVVGLVSTLLFMRISGSYKYAKPQGSFITTVSRVFVASASKMFCPLPRDANQLHENQRSSHYLPHTQGLRCLDKAAIVVSTQTLEQQEQNRWKLCSVTEVEETKIFVRMIPMWMIFIICGVVSSIGDSYFLAQATNLDRTVGRVKVPIFTLQVFQHIAESMFATFTKKLTKKVSGKYVAPIGMIIAIMFSVLCCITAAKVEKMRLDVIKSRGLFDKPTEKIPLSMFWLVPQFCFLGAPNGISHNLLGDNDGISGFSIACFFDAKVPDSVNSYLQIFSDSVFGVGMFGAVVSVYIVGKVSERGRKLSWFQKTLNKSRLDNYYWTLAVLSAINFVLSILVAIWYRYQHSAIEKIRTCSRVSIIYPALK